MATIKEICDKYALTHRQLGILIGYHPNHIQHINTGKAIVTTRFQIAIDGVWKGLEKGTIKIPK